VKQYRLNGKIEPQHTALTGVQVLCIDNEESILIGMHSLLSRWGCQVWTASNRAECEALLAEDVHPQLVLVDYHLDHGETGCDLMAWLRMRLGEPVPGVVISADGRPELIATIHAAGLDYLSKPLKPAALRALMSRHLPLNGIATDLPQRKSAAWSCEQTRPGLNCRLPLMTLELLLNLATALGVGLLIGTERSWSERHRDTQELAGMRTCGLSGLFGGLAVLGADHFGAMAWIAMFVVLALLVITGYLVESRANADHGLTTEVAMLLTFLLGSLAVAESRLLAAAPAVVVALLLSLKAGLQGALHKLSEEEVSGALKLLFISVVLLPALPNQGYGPWQAFNPYATWWMVVLIAGIGFAAYVAIRLLGTRHGLMVTALLGGIVSSTAMTLTLARLDSPRLRPALAAGLLATSALMFPRILLEVGLVNRTLLQPLIAPLLGAGLIYAAGALFYYLRAAQQPENPAELPLKNPFQLGPALRFAALLVLILFLVK